MQKLQQSFQKLVSVRGATTSSTESAQDKMKSPVDYVLPEIWDMIFKELDKGSCGNEVIDAYDETTDLLNCSRVCLTFKNILEESETIWLFKSVFPHLFLYLSPDQVLSLRQVCKTWRKVVDHFLENEEEYLRCHLDSARRYTCGIKVASLPAPLLPKNHLWFTSVSMATTTFFSATQIYGFVEQYKSSHIFPGNTMHLICLPENLDYDDYSEHNQFWNDKIIPLLACCGESIHGLSLHITLNPELSCLDFYFLLQKILRLTPNLKRFTVGANVSSEFNMSNDISEVFINESPKLPKLHVLKFSPGGRNSGRIDECSALPLQLQQFISAPYLPQLTRFQMSFVDGYWNNQGIDCWHPENMQNLVELTVTILSTDDLIHILSKLKSPLRNVTILSTRLWQVSSYSRQVVPVGPDPCLEDILRSLLKYKLTLEQLVIETNATKGRASQEDVELLRDFAMLRYLHIKNWELDHIRVIENIPPSLEFLRLPAEMACSYDGVYDTGQHRIKFYCRPRNHNPRHTGDLWICSDLPSADENDLLENIAFLLREKLPNLRWLSVCGNCGSHECGFDLSKMYVYDRECFDWEWELTRRQQEESRNDNDTQVSANRCSIA